jgi:hypothetical protein
MNRDHEIPPQVCPRCERENLPLAAACSCGQKLGGAPYMPAQGIAAGLGMSPVSGLQPGLGTQPRAVLRPPGAAVFVPDPGRSHRRRPRALRAAVVLGIGVVVVLVAAAFFGFLGSAQAEPAQSSSPSGQAGSSLVPGSSGAPTAGSTAAAHGSRSPAPGATGQVADTLATARLDAGTWAITHTVTGSTLEAVQVGDRERSTYAVTYACATPPCDLKVSARDPDSLAEAVVTTFAYLAGTYTGQERPQSARCIMGDGQALADAYQVHVTTSLHATAAKPQNGRSVATHLEGTQLREGVPTTQGAREGCKPWRIELATRGEPGEADSAAISRSVNWSGYQVQRKGARITAVEGTWVQPAVSCQSVHRQMASFWVGIDGVRSRTLEQIGTSSECSNKHQDLYYAWWEMIPAPTVRIPLLIRPGDTIHARITVSSQRFKLSITNVTLDNTFSITKSDSGAKQATAEWVAEATSMCGNTACQVSALPDFDSVRFTGCSATADGQTALLGDPMWAPTLDVMVVGGKQNTLKALPSAVDAGSDGFTVDWLSVGP